MKDYPSLIQVEPVPSIGRGTGCTIKEIRRALTAYMERKGIRGQQWKTLDDKRKLREPVRPCRIHKSDLWSLL